MTLILRTVRSPAGTGKPYHETTGRHVTVGRAAGCDWVLPDPNRLLSKRHFELSLRDGDWMLTDLSSNGMTINGHALIPGVPQGVSNGDRLAIGAYEIEVALQPAVPGEVGPFADEPFSGPAAGRGAAYDGRLIGDPFVGPGSGAPGSGTITDPFDVALPSAFDTGASAEAARRPMRSTQGDTVSDLRAPFQPPRPLGLLLPEDWDAPLEPVPPVAGPPAAGPPAAGIVDDAVERAGFPPEPAPFPPVPEAPFLDQAASEQPALDQTASEPPATVPAPPGEAVRRDDAGDGVAAFEAFVRGAGLSGTPHASPEILLGQLGRAFRAFVVGLRRIMIARATIKGEFRIERTMIQPSGNNPLKFAVDDDDALAALVGIGRHVGIAPEQVIADALQDVRLHEMAMTRALERALQELVAELAPDAVLGRLPPSALDAIPGRRKARAWNAHVAAHEKVAATLFDNLDSVFGRSFGRAYEAALAELAALETGDAPPPPASPGRRAS